MNFEIMLKIKILIIISSLSTILISCSQNNSNKESEFYVRGNCSMCKERIEKTVSGIEGVSKSTWDVKTKNLKVSYDSTKVNELKIQQTVANSGHETKEIASPKAANDALPECCKKGGMM